MRRMRVGRLKGSGRVQAKARVRKAAWACERGLTYPAENHTNDFSAISAARYSYTPIWPYPHLTDTMHARD